MKKTPHHIIQSFSWGQCKICALQHISKSSALLIFKSPQRWSCPILSMRGCSTVLFIWLSIKGFCSHVLSCSQKPCNSTCVFPGYQNCIYLLISVLQTHLYYSYSCYLCRTNTVQRQGTNFYSPFYMISRIGLSVHVLTVVQLYRWKQNNQAFP